ncbi:hypothetical protein POTOM_049729 [Populus tomentosa]|uniref:Uncharacterized protein n=1 Tax=Populus tomentosa TaxID=118781 RepID=A0A8X7YAS9_POPTO|nr:hypothetical protein POTOM_049729 [Populus tomentosa]
MSGSSPDEELEKLEKIVADKDQELERQQRVLEHKDRELEQLRSSLTASAPQQGIDSLPRSLPTQIDDQGINCNKEISLSME